MYFSTAFRNAISFSPNIALSSSVLIGEGDRLFHMIYIYIYIFVLLFLVFNHGCYIFEPRQHMFVYTDSNVEIEHLTIIALNVFLHKFPHNLDIAETTHVRQF